MPGVVRAADRFPDVPFEQHQKVLDVLTRARYLRLLWFPRLPSEAGTRAHSARFGFASRNDPPLAAISRRRLAGIQRRP